jgi:class 3 adenylate cyclase/tetratricopeptide (TPR) repeat protein
MTTSRLVAILFADLVDSTATVARLGSETGEVWRQRFLSAMREGLATSRGREVQHTGDGLFAAFDSASDAVACAVRLQQRVARASRRRDAPAPAEARVGVAAGEAREDAEGVHGLVVVEAARLCRAAKRGQILASALVETLAAGGPHRFAPAGELSLKGMPAPVSAREIAWEGGGETMPLSPRLATMAREAFVGRIAERARLDAAFDVANAGERHVALVAGEPGIGKTRLAVELARDANAAGAIVLDGRCNEDLGAPFQPWMQALAHFSLHTPEPELRALFAREVVHALPLLPELRRRLPDLTSGTSGDAEPERWRLFEAIDALLAGASLGAPVVVLLDDLHWADQASLALLRHVAHSARPAAILLLGTYRETDLGRTHPLSETLADLRRESDVTRVLLHGLDRAELGELVAVRAEHSTPSSFVDALHAETEGNPFFADEVLRHVIEAGALRREQGGWTADRALAEIGIPEGVRDVIGRRLSRLSETANWALRAASVIGREFELPELEAASGLARDALLDAIDEAGRARIAVEVPGAPGRFAFAHALIRSTLYDELGSAQRMRLHWRVGEALERRHARDLDPHAAAIAQHFAQGVLAGDPLRSADASLRAAARAAALAGHEDANSHFERALATLDQAGLDEPERRCAAWQGIGQSLLCLADVRFCGAFLEEFRIAERQGWTERMAEAALAATQMMEPALFDRVRPALDAAISALGAAPRMLRVHLLNRRAFAAHFADADYDAMEAGFREAEAVAARVEGDPELRYEFQVVNTADFLLIGSPRLVELEESAQLELEKSRSDRPDRPMLSTGYFNYVLSAMARGDRQRVDARISEIATLAERRGWHGALQVSRTWRGALALAEGRFDEAERIEAEGYEMWRKELPSTLMFRSVAPVAWLERGRNAAFADAAAAFLKDLPRWTQYYRTWIAVAFAEFGRAEQALAALAAYDALALQPRGWSWPFALRYLAEAAALLDDAERAAAVLPQVEPYAGQMLVAYTGVVIHAAADRSRGQCLATLGRLDEAIACYESALALEESFGAPALAARTRYWLARALAARGDIARARAEAEVSRDAARRFGMMLLAERADALAAGGQT